LSVLVVDASVAAKWFFNEVHSPAAADLRQIRAANYAPLRVSRSLEPLAVGENHGSLPLAFGD